MCPAFRLEREKHVYIYLEEYNVEVSKDSTKHFASYLTLFTSHGIHQRGWNASTPDLLATDWEIVNRTQQ
jgi:hypothetical protein